MKAERNVRHKIASDIAVSIFLYTTPVFLMLLSFYLTGARPWENYVPTDAKVHGNSFIAQVFNHLASWGLPLLMVIVGITEFGYGLYENRWSKNERILDIVCFVLPKVIVGPFVTYTLLKLLPVVWADGKNIFGWVPFWWGFFIIAVADDLTQYWYHRLHH